MPMLSKDNKLPPKLAAHSMSVIRIKICGGQDGLIALWYVFCGGSMIFAYNDLAILLSRDQPKEEQ
jgi:hypothetical protein